VCVADSDSGRRSWDGFVVCAADSDSGRHSWDGLCV